MSRSAPSRLMTGTLFILAVAAAVYAAVCLLLYASQRGMLYFPTAESHHAPGAAVVRLQSGGERLKIWRIGAPAGADAVLYFGGNAEDVAWNIPGFAAIFPGRTVYLANYRGYGGSSGAPSQAGLFADALALYDHARASHHNIALIGRSLGSAVAAHVAAEREADKLVLVTPFDSVLNVARGMFPLFPVGLLLKDRYDSAARVADIRAPTLIFIAGRDRVIPRRRSEALVRAFPAAQVSVQVMEHANHHNIGETAAYAGALAAFVNRGSAP